MNAYLNYLKHFTAWSIRKDAALGVDTSENRVLEAFGIRPEYNPVDNAEHGQWAEAMNRDPEVEERKADVEAKQKEYADHSRPWFLRLMLLAFFVAELTSCILVFAARGIEPPERIVFGAALAAGVFLVTYYLVMHGAKAAQGGEP